MYTVLCMTKPEDDLYLEIGREYIAEDTGTKFLIYFEEMDACLAYNKERFQVTAYEAGGDGSMFWTTIMNKG